MAEIELVRDDGGRIRIAPSKRSIYFGNRVASFTEIEWEILKSLYFNLSKPVSRESLLSLLKGQEHSSNTRIVDVHVSSIRGKLQKIKVARIKSIYGFGYVLLASQKK